MPAAFQVLGKSLELKLSFIAIARVQRDRHDVQ